MGYRDINKGDIVLLLSDGPDYFSGDYYYLVHDITESAAHNGFELNEIEPSLKVILICKGIENCQNWAWLRLEDQDKRWKIISS